MTLVSNKKEMIGISLNKKYSKIHAGNYVRGGKAAGYFGVIDVTEFEFREQGVWIEIFVSNTGDHVARLVIKLDPKTDIKF